MPARREVRRRFRIGVGSHEPNGARDEIAEGERAFGDAQCERRGPPWPNRRFGGSDREETNERQQGERARRDEGPETAPAVDSTHGVRVDPWPDGRWNEPEGQDQPLLVEPGADGDALI